MKQTILIFCLLLCLLMAGCGEALPESPSSIPLIPGKPTVSTTTTVTTTVSTTSSTTTVSTTAPTSPPYDLVGEQIAQRATLLLGSLYEYGGTGPYTFDNPGFVYYCYRQQGISVPRRAINMAEGGIEIPQDQLLPGDIVLFSHEVGGPAGFAGIYIGNGRFVACHNPETNTVERDMTTRYYQTHFVTARRYR